MKARAILIGKYQIDAAIREEPSHEVEATRYPRESGTSSVDHAILLPLRLVIEGVVSDSPIGDMARVRESERFETVGAEGVVIDTTGAPSRFIRAALVAIAESREPVDVSTSTDTYQNMLLTRLTMPRDRDTGDALRFTAEFEQSTIVETVRVRVSRSPAGAKGSLGSQPSPSGKVRPPGLYGGDSWYDESVSGGIWRYGYRYDRATKRNVFKKGRPHAADYVLPKWRTAADDKAFAAALARMGGDFYVGNNYRVRESRFVRTDIRIAQLRNGKPGEVEPKATNFGAYSDLDFPNLGRSGFSIQ